MPGHRGREYSRLEWPNRGHRPPARPLPRTPVAVAPAPRSVRYDPSMTMKSVDPAHLRSVVLAGHAGGGKTTLAEHLLFQAGAIQRLGKVDDGSAHLDYEPEEQKRQQTLSLAVATFEHEGTRITLVDTPGYPDFVAEVVSGFAAADGALFVADASGTVEAGLETGVALGRSTGRAACFFINKCDKEHANPTAALDALRGRFGNKIAPLHVAIGAGEAFEGYVDLVHRKAYRFDGGSEVEVPIPDGLADEVAKRRDQLLEAAAEADDDVLTKYLEGEEISDEELDACLHRGVRDSILAPVLVGSAAKGIGINALLDAFIRYMPTAAEEPAVAAKNAKTGADATINPDPSGQLVARVVKTAADPFVGRLTYLRVLSGTLHGQAHAWNANREEDERIGQLLPLDFPVPTLTVAIEPQTKADLDKMGAALQRMLEEEPSARVERSATGEQLLVATGEAHIAVIGERLKRKFGAAIVTRTPKIPYRETIRGTTKVEGRYKKQTGGHGMFGHVWIEIEPNPGGGVQFAEKVVGGSVPKGFFPGVEKGIREAAAEGVLAGYPLSDFKATLFDGSFHTVDSNELSFKIAASMALKKGVLECKPGLLEPIMTIAVKVPEEYMGDVNRDLNTRRGRVLGMDTSDGMQVVSAQVPQAELFTYATELRSLTHGRGTFTAELDHYEEVPSHIAEKVIDAHRKEAETTGSH